MFISKRRFEVREENVEAELRNLQNKYWRLYADHRRLLDHLGLVEVEIKQATVLREKGGPEQPQ